MSFFTLIYDVYLSKINRFFFKLVPSLFWIVKVGTFVRQTYWSLRCSFYYLVYDTSGFPHPLHLTSQFSIENKYIKILLYLVFLWIVYVSTICWILSRPIDKNIQSNLIKLHMLRTGTAIYSAPEKKTDNQKMLIGAIPNAFPKKNGITPTSSVIQKILNNNKLEDKLLDYTKNPALYVDLNDNSLNVYWQTLKYAEDRKLNFEDHENSFWKIISFQNSSYNGYDILSPLYRIPLDIINKICYKLPFPGICKKLYSGGGGSSLQNQLIKNLIGPSTFKSTWDRKISEFTLAPQIFTYLAANDGLEFKRWVSMHFPHGTSNGTIFGVRSASAVYFGHNVSRISEGEQAFLARTINPPLPKISSGKIPDILDEERVRDICKNPTDNNKNQFQSDWKFSACWKYSANNSISIIKNLLKKEIIKDTDILSNLKKIKSSEPKEFKMSNILDKYTCKSDFGAGNLNERLSKATPALLNLMPYELSNFYKEGLLVESQLVSDVTTSIPFLEDYMFRRALDMRLLEIEKNIRHKLRVGLLPCDISSINHCATISPNEAKSANIHVMVTDENGEIVRYYQRGANVSIEPTYTGSLSKVIAGVLLASINPDIASTYCNKYYNGKQNSNNDKGVHSCKNQDMISITKTFSASMNLPLREALNKELNIRFGNNHENKINFLVNIYNDFSLKAPNLELIKNLTYKNADYNYLIEGLSFGNGYSSPLQLHAIMQSITSSLNNQFKTLKPSFIKEIKIAKVSFVEGVLDDVNLYSHVNFCKNMVDANFCTAVPELNRYIHTQKSKDYIKSVLSAPFTGTLRFAKAMEKEFNDVHFIIGKTGTTDNITAKLAVGSVIVNKKGYVFSIVIKSPDNTPLGYDRVQDITHNELIKPILEEIIKSLTNPYYSDELTTSSNVCL